MSFCFDGLVAFAGLFGLAGFECPGGTAGIAGVAGLLVGGCAGCAGTARTACPCEWCTFFVRPCPLEVGAAGVATASTVLDVWLLEVDGADVGVLPPAAG